MSWQADVEMIGAQPMQADVNAFGDALGGEIKMLQVITAEFRAEHITVARHVAQRDAEQHFAHPAPIKRRRVDEVQARIQRDAARCAALRQLTRPKLLAERRSPKAQDRQL